MRFTEGLTKEDKEAIETLREYQIHALVGKHDKWRLDSYGKSCQH